MVSAIIVASDEFTADCESGPLQNTSLPVSEIAGILMQGGGEYFRHHIGDRLIGKCATVVLAKAFRAMAEGAILILRHGDSREYSGNKESRRIEGGVKCEFEFLIRR